jgi:hypothetical protein
LVLVKAKMFRKNYQEAIETLKYESHLESEESLEKLMKTVADFEHFKRLGTLNCFIK